MGRPQRNGFPTTTKLRIAVVRWNSCWKSTNLTGSFPFYYKRSNHTSHTHTHKGSCSCEACSTWNMISCPWVSAPEGISTDIRRTQADFKGNTHVSRGSTMMRPDVKATANAK